MRQKLEPDDSLATAVVKMAEGNPGGANVLTQLLSQPDGMLVVLDLDDMNIRGSQIWVAYKDWAGESLDTLIEGVRSRNPELVALLNDPQYGFAEKAVTGGASFRRPDDAS